MDFYYFDKKIQIGNIYGEIYVPSNHSLTSSYLHTHQEETLRKKPRDNSLKF